MLPALGTRGEAMSWLRYERCCCRCRCCWRLDVGGSRALIARALPFAVKEKAAVQVRPPRSKCLAAGCRWHRRRWRRRKPS